MVRVTEKYSLHLLALSNTPFVTSDLDVHLMTAMRQLHIQIYC
jgi:hypothetical protein